MRIGIVNNTPMIAEALRQVVTSIPEYRVAWIAHSGDDAVRFCTGDTPDLVLMDLVMRDMDGVQATRLIMEKAPCAILIVTATPDDNTNLVFKAIGAGALDVTATPILNGEATRCETLLYKIKTVGKLIKAEASSGKARKNGGTAVEAPQHKVDTLLAIGASTGGPVALAKILTGLKPASGTAIVVVQHIDQDFSDSFAKWLSSQVGLPVDVIQEGGTLAPGRILLAKTNDHLLMDEHHRLSYSSCPRGYPYRPSVDVFFECVARHWRGNAIGVLLTGMGRDGAQGLLALRRAGKLTMAQDQASCAVYGMPRAAAELNAADMILSLEDIAITIRRHISVAT